MAEIKIEGVPSNTEGGALARLWRRILNETNKTQALDYLLGNYLAKVQNKKGIQNVPSLKGKTKSTLIKNIGALDMTIKTFFDLLFNIFGAKRVVLSVKITHATNLETIHSVIVESNSIAETSLTDEQDDDVEEEKKPVIKRNKIDKDLYTTWRE